jgi:hypothetical protein
MQTAGIKKLGFKSTALSPWRLVILLGALVAIAFAALAANAATSNVAPTLSKQDIINRLKEVQERQGSELRSLDDGIKKRLAESTTVSLKSVDLKLADRRISRLGGQVDDLNRRRLEFSARRDFLNNLIFTIDTKWNGEALNTFLEHSFLDMAMTDVSDSRGESRLAKFLMYASIAVREAPEPREDVLNVLESYINFANILDPKTPALFIASRSYTNGSLSYTAKPVPRDEVGDNLDKKLRELSQQPVTEKTAPPAKVPADIELRLPPIAGPPTNDDAGTSSATTMKVDSANASDEQPRAVPAKTAAPAKNNGPGAAPNVGPAVAPSPTPAQRSLPKNLPPINPTNGGAVPPAPPDVPGQNN